MEVILLERVAKLGQMGETVKVRDGYARNFLLPAARRCAPPRPTRSVSRPSAPSSRPATSSAAGEAEGVGEKLDGQSFMIIRQAGETGVLYGSVSTRDLAEIVDAGRLLGRPRPDRAQPPIKTLGLHKVPVVLHPEVEVKVTINVARSPRKPSARPAARTSRPARRRTSTISASRSARPWPKPATSRC